MPIWSIDSFDLDDEINKDIWGRSRDVAAGLGEATPPGGADVLQHGLGLPWVPDLVGRRWKEPGSVLVVGSAYSPFMGTAGRAHAMPMADYREARSAAQFQRSFVANVVVGDGSYYDPIGHLLDAAVGDRERFVLLDLVRGCFARADGSGGDGAVAADPALFMDNARAGWAWTRRRLIESGAETIVVLGSIAEHGLIKLLREHKLTPRVHGRPDVMPASVKMDVTKAASALPLSYYLTPGRWWEVKAQAEGRVRCWRILPVYHPSWRNKHDPGYKRTVQALRAALAAHEGVVATEVQATEAMSPPRTPPRRPTERDPVSRMKARQKGRLSGDALRQWPYVKKATTRANGFGQPSGGMTQRDMMRRLWGLHGPNEDRVASEYARAEAAGEVARSSNEHGVSSNDYARRLLNDGKKKGWL